MSQQVPQQRSRADAARGDAASTPPADRPLPGFPHHDAAPPASGPHAQIEREIERSERASAALAATRALARAAFTDSQLAADDAAAGDADFDHSGWVRTEYAALDHSVREPQDDVAHDGAQHNLVGGGFNPGLAFQSVRAFPGASVAQAPMRTRGGAQARFMQESRHAPRPERGVVGAPRSEHSLARGAGLYDKPAVLPMQAASGGSPVQVAPPRRVAAPVRTPARASSGELARLVLAVGAGAVVVLMGGAVALKAGWLARGTPAAPPPVVADVAAKAEAARVMSAAQQQLSLDPPAAGTPAARSEQEVDAALAAAARAAAVPVASVHAAGPARAPRPVVPQAAAPVARDGVAAAIANAQARADKFLSSGDAVPAPAPEAKPAQ